jgi:hypothetical protein
MRVKYYNIWLLGSAKVDSTPSLQCCLHATALLAVKYSAELSTYILSVRVICEKYRFREQSNFPSPLGKLASPLNRYFSQITLTNRIYVFKNQLPVTSHVTEIFYHIHVHVMPYRVHIALAGFEFTTLVVRGTDCTGSFKSNYRTITTMTTPKSCSSTTIMDKMTLGNVI